MLRWKMSSVELDWYDYEPEESLVYHEISGDTHLLNPVSVAVLRALEVGSLSVDELLTVLNRQCALLSDGNSSRSITELLEKLEALGLIEPAP